MGKLKKEMKKIHAKKTRNVKEKVKTYLKGELPYDKLNKRAKEFIAKQKKKQTKKI